MSEKKQFMAQYGAREHAIKSLLDPATDIHSVGDILKNPQLTHDDLIKLAYHHDQDVSYRAMKECHRRGIENVSFRALKDPSKPTL